MRLARTSILWVLAVAGGMACGSPSTTGPSDGGAETGEMQSDASSDGPNAADQISGPADAGTDASTTNDGGDAGDASDARDTGDAGGAADATDALASDAFGSGSPCPSSIPAGACSPMGLACEYGDAIQIGCDTVATCGTGGWQVQAAGTCSSWQPDGGICPATIADVPNGVACTPSGLICPYPTGICYCTMDHTGAPLIWTCFPQSGCPYPRPRLGDVCTTDGQQCDYSGCGASILCSQGTWHQGNGGCHP